MSNQNFKYFEWGIHQESNKNFYALASNRADMLYLVSKDKDLLIQIHFILLSTRHTTILNLVDIKNYYPGIIDNSVCLQWKLDNLVPKMGNGSMSNFRTEFGTETLVYKNTLPDQCDIEFQKNLFYISKILNLTDFYLMEKLKYYFEDLDYLSKLEKFLSIKCNNDLSAIDLVKTDKDLLLLTKTKLDNIKNKIIFLLSSVDYNQDYVDLLKNLNLITQLQNEFSEYTDFIKLFLAECND